MKNVLNLGYLILMVSIIIGCAKGDGDAKISLKSRKNRLVGVWNIDSWYRVSDYTNNSTSNNTQSSMGTTWFYQASNKRTSKSNQTIDGNSVSTILNSYTESSNSSSTSTETQNKNGKGSALATIEFEKDGTFTRKLEFTNQNFTINKVLSGSGITANVSITSIETSIETSTGSWEFLGGIQNEYKNKERIILNVKSSTITNSITSSDGTQNNSTQIFSFLDGQSIEIWKLNTLKKDELVFEAVSKMTNDYSTKGNELIGNSTNSNEYTFQTTEIGTMDGTLSKVD